MQKLTGIESHGTTESNGWFIREDILRTVKRRRMLTSYAGQRRQSQHGRAQWLISCREIEYPDIWASIHKINSKMQKSGCLPCFCWWIGSDISLASHLETFLTLPQVKHSQITVEKLWTVLCAHCTCMEGLGESWFHIATFLFILEDNVQVKKRLSSICLPSS